MENFKQAHDASSHQTLCDRNTITTYEKNSHCCWSLSHSEGYIEWAAPCSRRRRTRVHRARVPCPAPPTPSSSRPACFPPSPPQTRSTCPAHTTLQWCRYGGCCTNNRIGHTWDNPKLRDFYWLLNNSDNDLWKSGNLGLSHVGPILLRTDPHGAPNYKLNISCSHHLINNANASSFWLTSRITFWRFFYAVIGDL